MVSYSEIYDQWKRVYATTDGTSTDSKYGGYNKPHSTQLYPEEIEKVIFNGPATIVIWCDGTKTVVKCGNMDIYDPEKGLAMAICKYVFGNEGKFKRVFRKWLPKEEKAGDEMAGTPLGELGSLIRKIFSPDPEE